MKLSNKFEEEVCVNCEKNLECRLGSTRRVEQLHICATLVIWNLLSKGN